MLGTVAASGEQCQVAVFAREEKQNARHLSQATACLSRSQVGNGRCPRKFYSEGLQMMFPGLTNRNNGLTNLSYMIVLNLVWSDNILFCGFSAVTIWFH